METVTKVYGEREIFEKSAGGRPSSADLDLINAKFAAEPLTAEDIYVRKAWVCSDQLDSDGDRFEHPFLERLASTLPGRPMMIGHAQDGYGCGKWFDADLTRASVTGVDAEWMVGRVYIPVAGRESLLADLKAGLAHYVSIRAAADEKVIRKDARGKPLYRTYVAKPWAEGSKARALSCDLVWAGAQPGAALQKAIAAAYGDTPGAVDVRIGGRMFTLDNPELVAAVKALDTERESFAKALESFGLKDVKPASVERIRLLLECGRKVRPDLLQPESKAETPEPRLRPMRAFRTSDWRL
jgi:hypothetical protein